VKKNWGLRGFLCAFEATFRFFKKKKKKLGILINIGFFVFFFLYSLPSLNRRCLCLIGPYV
jgi:uncharacterized membrane protein (DUF485 family)